MPSELTLIHWERFAELISLFATFILLKSLNIAEETEILNSQGKQPPPTPGPSSSELTAIALWLLLLDRAIFAKVAFIRLDELKIKNQQAEKKTPIGPNLKITNGYVLVIIGTLLIALGAQEKANMDQPVTIL